MSLSMHQISAPVFLRVLKALDAVLAKAQAEVDAGRLREEELMEARLAPDMFPLPRQVQIASDSAKLAMARLAGKEAPVWPDEETTLAQLRQRIARTLDYVAAVPPSDLDDSQGRTVQLKLRMGEMQFTGEQFLLHFAMPNLYFHVTTAYDILRHKGVPLVKADFIGGA